MITAERALELSIKSVEKKIEFIEKIIVDAAQSSKTDIFINSQYITGLVEIKLIKLGYTIGLSNNGMTNISWKWKP